MHFPEILKPYLQLGKRLLEKGFVKQIEFSGGTYQVQVYDEETHEDVWSFLQLDKNNELRDCFCSCHESEDVAICSHIAAGYLRIFKTKEQPLHELFEASLWNKIARLYSDQIEDIEESLKELKKGEYALFSEDGKTLFYLKGNTKLANEKIKELIFDRQRETEETSLKFSNLSDEEILLWKLGKPTNELKYELSFFADFSKWLYFLQETGEEPKIKFDYENEIPNFIHAKFKEVTFSFYLPSQILETIIPALNTVPSPLKVFGEEEGPKKIIYDPLKHLFKLEPNRVGKRENDVLKKEGRIVGEFLFVKNEGFYPLEKETFSDRTEIEEKEIAPFLRKNFQTIESDNVSFQKKRVKPSYHLFFDQNFNLHIDPYLFLEGDLRRIHSKFFDEFIYIESKDGEGIFYILDDPSLSLDEKIIPESEVAEYVRQNRTFFNGQKGFKTHLSTIQGELYYNLSEDDKLTFTKKNELKNYETEEVHDFGTFIYLEGEGFYTKVGKEAGLPVMTDIAISKNQIPLFISKNREDLEHVTGFFSKICPVVASSLKISLTDENKIEIKPLYEIREEYENKTIRYFDDYCFVEGEGFHELPLDSKLPEPYRHFVEIEKEEETYFLTHELKKLKPYAVSIDKRLEIPSVMKLKCLRMRREEKYGKGFYRLKLGIETEKGLISIFDILSAIKKKMTFLFHDKGLIDLREKNFEWLRLLGKNRIDRKEEELILSTLELIRLNAFQELEMVEEENEEKAGSSALLKELIEFKNVSEPDLEGLKSHLRAYQTTGVKWLWFLYCHNLSGILSDDMGLGKTHQAMALLASIRNLEQKSGGGEKKQFLIICPTSVIYHWQEKLETFLPNVKICTFHGGKRNLTEKDQLGFKEEYDVLLTSYGVFRIDQELLSKLHFEVAIFDEIQVAKNHNSRIYSSLLKVNAGMRLGLTGTPIENRLRELKTLFDLMIPGYMPKENDFRDFFVRPIEKEQNLEKRQLLTKFIKPFLLRRKKSQVLLDLPEKIEEVAHAELSDNQKILYNEIVEKGRNQLLNELENEKGPIPYMHIFAILSALKQICDHPAVFYKEPENYKNYSSGKWDLFVELLSEALESEQKVVVFSQYLGMLDIMEEYLNEKEIGFATIRGSTVNRGEEIRRFNQNPECRVFIGSLQASGLGLDLTGASIVIHYDRWWNAARENQATDRVHRIGQTRGVQVFKLVTKNTIEEKIDRLIFKKGKLMEEVVTIDDHQIVKQFTRDEIKQLLQFS